MSDFWKPSQYDKFKTQRQAPFHDLLAMVLPDGVRDAVDLGCGTGETTRILHERLAGGARTLGLDDSQAMLAEAAAWQAPGLTFAAGRLEAWQSNGGVDLIFANASLQWNADHEALLARLRGQLRPGGQLAFQVPDNFTHVSHTLAAELGLALGNYQRVSPVLPVERYAERLHQLGFKEQAAVTRIYGHVLPSPTDVVEWVKGTLLTDYQKRFPPELFKEFLDLYRERLADQLGPAGQPYFYAFKRTLVWGRL